MKGGYVRTPWGLIRAKDINPTAKLVFVYLIGLESLSSSNGWKDPNGTTFVRISTRRLADELNLSKNTVVKALQSLEETGRIKRRITRNQEVNEYYVKGGSKNDPVGGSKNDREVGQFLTEGGSKIGTGIRNMNKNSFNNQDNKPSYDLEEWNRRVSNIPTYKEKQA